MIVREKTTRYIAFTWQEFVAAITPVEPILPQETTFMGRRCVRNQTHTGYFVYDKDRTEHIMNEDTVMVLYGENNEYTIMMNSTEFWNRYERVIWN